MSFKALVNIIAGRPILTRKDLARRYGVDLDTIDRWKARGTLPRPIRLPGCRIPMWTPEQIYSNENRSKKLLKHVTKI